MRRQSNHNAIVDVLPIGVMIRLLCEEGDAVHKTPSVNESFKLKISPDKCAFESPLAVRRFQRVFDLYVTQ